MNMLSDFSWWMYVVEFIGGVWMFVLFFHWYREDTGELGTVFVCMLMLSVGIMWGGGLNVVARTLRFVNEPQYVPFMGTNWWATRKIVFLTTLYTLNFAMTRRYLGVEMDERVEGGKKH